MLAMWVPELPFQLACGREGGLEGRPLAFLNPEQPRTPTLWFVNRLARAEGLRAGEPMDQALRRLPGLRVLDPAPQTWWEAHASMADFLVRWTPQGQLGRMGEALVELHGTEGLYGPAQDAAGRIRRELRGSHGWVSHGGLSESATAAHLAAHLERELEQDTPGAELAAFQRLLELIVFISRCYDAPPAENLAAVMRVGRIISLLESEFMREWRLEELAKLHEHRTGDLPRALERALQALEWADRHRALLGTRHREVRAALAHRIERLRRKGACASSCKREEGL